MCEHDYPGVRCQVKYDLLRACCTSDQMVNCIVKCLESSHMWLTILSDMCNLHVLHTKWYYCTGWARKKRSHRLVTIILSILNDLRNFLLEDS